jgi:hypothetical protein
MKALSIKQPWADLIASGAKDIENRSWRTHFRGRVYIHASAKMADYVFTSEQVKILVKSRLSKHDLTFSAIIGEVDIVDCVINHQSIWAEHMRYFTCEETGINILYKGQDYIWNWVLANPVKYDQPIMNVKGSLGFWNYESLTTQVQS